MKFILLYGPPATGKLTVAKELQKLSGYKLFHNHLLVDLLQSIDSERTADFYKTHDEIFDSVIKFAVQRDVNLINTFVYGKGVDDKFMQFFRDEITKNGGKVIFVQITADKEELLKRVSEGSRKEFGKMSDPEKLSSLMTEYDVLSPFEGTELIINNTNKNPIDTASEIWEFVQKN